MWSFSTKLHWLRTDWTQHWVGFHISSVVHSHSAISVVYLASWIDSNRPDEYFID